MDDQPVDDQRVLILPPTRRDGEVTRELLQRSGLAGVVCRDAAQLAEAIQKGAGALLLTDAALSSPGFEQMLEQLGTQPAWSDMPVVLLCAPEMYRAVSERLMARLTNVTLLDRPSSARTLVSGVQAAIRGRGRQYQTREQLLALQAAEEALRGRERQLETLAEQLRRADRLKDEFLAMLAHELRNPLAPIRSASELLERTLPPDPQLHAPVAILRRQATQLSRLVDDLLDVSRITQGRIELHRETLDVPSIIDQAIESIEPLIRQRAQQVRISGVRAGHFVSGDRARLVQCLGNLLNNAAKYTDAGGHIDIEVRTAADQVHIRVRDDGVGIPAELLPQVFELFVQGDRSLDRSQGGLGIGLSVVRRLIEMHAGSVTAHSDGVGRGASFELSLPLVPEPLRPDAPADRQRGAAKRILVVDDNVDAADSLALILSYEGHSATTVYNAADALKQAFTDFAPHVILLDIGMPGMDGYEVARRLRSGGSTAQLIALTGYGRGEDVKRAKDEGFDLHMVKPVDIPALLQRLAS
ncbi:MAG TPA: ATP-binding protein [Steroidobacteraceae bacterium]|nr:ATP-binding protein [Steroidobacteraceae bacterium]